MSELVKPTPEVTKSVELPTPYINRTLAKLAYGPQERNHMLLNLHNGAATDTSCVFYLARTTFDKQGASILYENLTPGLIFVPEDNAARAQREALAYLDIGVRNMFNISPADYAKRIAQIQHEQFIGQQISIQVTSPEQFVYNPDIGLIAPPPVLMVMRQYGNPQRRLLGYDATGQLFMKEASLDLGHLQESGDISQATTLEDFNF